MDKKVLEDHGYHELTIEYMVTDGQYKKLESMLPIWNEYVDDFGKKPFEHYTVQNVFEFIMLLGSKKLIENKIEELLIFTEKLDGYM